MTISLRESLGLISDPRNLDTSVNEVFGTMLGVQCTHEPGPNVFPFEPSPELVTAVVGFGGLLSGACVVKSGAPDVMKMAERMTGMQFQEVDETVKDAIGEICNMLAGAWKSKVPDLASHCGLSVPAIITGRDYVLRVQAPEFQLEHIYAFEGSRFLVTIVCDGVQ